ncbi:hypothetical protein [Tropicimonas marinistellae]|uniref:hypothetical protein n=1 Tax=Tropicimonas marinistellae TaxID=1739787 RepID=UPI00082F5350|nr:hypothetical protein [Tropicimonas marinistellae]
MGQSFFEKHIFEGETISVTEGYGSGITTFWSYNVTFEEGSAKKSDFNVEKISGSQVGGFKSFSVTAIDDDENEDDETFTVTLSGEYGTEGSLRAYEYTYSFIIIDNECPYDRSDLKKIKDQISSLKEDRGSFDLLSQNLDTIGDGYKVVKKSEKAWDVSQAVAAKVLKNLDADSEKSLRSELRDLKNNTKELHEQLDGGKLNFLELEEAQKDVRESTKSLVQAARKEGISVSRTPFENELQLERATKQAENVYSIISTESHQFGKGANLFSFWIELLKTNNENIERAGIQAVIDDQLDSYRPQLREYAKELRIKSTKGVDTEDLIEKVDSKFDRILDKLKQEKIEIKKCLDGERDAVTRSAVREVSELEIDIFTPIDSFDWM